MRDRPQAIRAITDALHADTSITSFERFAEIAIDAYEALPVVVTAEMVERAAAAAVNNAQATGVDVGTWDECPEPDRSELLADFRLALEEALRT